LEKSNMELSRDVQVRDALKGLHWRNDVASEMAYKEIASQLSQDDKGQWLHKSGVTIREFVKQFAKDEDKSFLFKPKVSSGSGLEPSGSTNTDTKGKKPLSEHTQKEVIEMAARGEFGPIPAQ
jgi:hypothetical protein